MLMSTVYVVKFKGDEFLMGAAWSLDEAEQHCTEIIAVSEGRACREDLEVIPLNVRGAPPALTQQEAPHALVRWPQFVIERS